MLDAPHFLGLVQTTLAPYSGLQLYVEIVLGFPLPLRERDRVRGKGTATSLLIQTKNALVADLHTYPRGRLRVPGGIACSGRQGVRPVRLAVRIPRELELGRRRFTGHFPAQVLPVELELHPRHLPIIYRRRRQRHRALQGRAAYRPRREERTDARPGGAHQGAGVSLPLPRGR